MDRDIAPQALTGVNASIMMFVMAITTALLR
jgi:hypothetical protein